MELHPSPWLLHRPPAAQSRHHRGGPCSPPLTRTLEGAARVGINCRHQCVVRMHGLLEFDSRTRYTFTVHMMSTWICPTKMHLIVGVSVV
jgi:hypothetical protein